MSIPPYIPGLDEVLWNMNASSRPFQKAAKNGCTVGPTDQQMGLCDPHDSSKIEAYCTSICIEQKKEKWQVIMFLTEKYFFVGKKEGSLLLYTAWKQGYESF